MTIQEHIAQTLGICASATGGEWFDRKCGDIVEQHVAEIIEGEGMQGEVEEEFRGDVERDVLRALNDGEGAFYAAVNDFVYEGGAYFLDFWESDCTSYTYRYLWCCYAIVWAIQQYDAAMKEKAA